MAVNAGVLFLLVALLPGLVGCVTSTQGVADKTANYPIWPKPPDRPRFLAEIILRSPKDIQAAKQVGLLDALAGGEQDSINIFQKPVNVSASQGRVYVVDSVARVVRVFDVKRRRVFTIGFRREGTLGTPTGIAVGHDGLIYVADSRLRRVVVYDSLGLFVRIIGNKEELVRPSGVATSPDGQLIYIVETGGVTSKDHQLLIYNAEGELLSRIGSRGSDPGFFNLPTDVAVGPDGTVFVLDSGNFRVQAFDKKGKFLRTWGQAGQGLGQFARPRGIAVDGLGRVYVTDSIFSNIQIFNSEGQLLMPFGDRGVEDGPGHFVLPAGIDVDETGRVYVVDQYHRKVEVFRPIPEGEGNAILEGRWTLEKGCDGPC